MKKLCLVLVFLFVGSGCVCMEISPASGPAGTPVYVKSKGFFGDPVARCIKWDGKEISRPCTSSFMVPSTANGGTPGKHHVTLVDELDAAEAMLLFPLFRLRTRTVTFEVTESYVKQE